MRYLELAALALTMILLAAHRVQAQANVIQQNSSSWQPGVVQQNSVSVNGEGSSVTISGRSISVDTSTTGGRVIGDGQPASENRPIGPVAAIHSDGAFALTVMSGPAPKLIIEADKNLLPIIKTTVSNGRLDIYADRSYSVDGRIKITVASPSISEISASGSNHIEAAGFAGGPLSVALNGSNTAIVAGRAATLTIVLSGANHLSAQGLAASSARATLNGSGDATVDARDAIVAQINGAGAITVYGNPKARSTQVNGAGKISFVQ